MMFVYTENRLLQCRVVRQLPNRGGCGFVRVAGMKDTSDIYQTYQLTREDDILRGEAVALGPTRFHPRYKMPSSMTHTKRWSSKQIVWHSPKDEDRPI
jgi:hypothetical protein